MDFASVLNNPDISSSLVQSFINLCPCVSIPDKLTKQSFTLIFVKLFDYWGIIWAEPVIWFLMVIPLIVMTIRNPIFKKEGR
jgi:hypothetical protein